MTDTIVLTVQQIAIKTGKKPNFLHRSQLPSLPVLPHLHQNLTLLSIMFFFDISGNVLPFFFGWSLMGRLIFYLKMSNSHFANGIRHESSSLSKLS